MTDLGKIEQTIAAEAKREEKEIKAATKSLTSAEKNAKKAAKVEDKAVHSRDKALNKENKTSHKFSDAQAAHNNALADQKKADTNLANKAHQHQVLEKEIAAKKAALEQAEKHHREGEIVRSNKLEGARSSLSGGAAAAPVSENPPVATTANRF